MFKDVTIYQCKAQAGYCFMNYDFAKDKIKMGDYNKVADFRMKIEDDDAVLETLFIEGNNGYLQEQYPMRSISVSDIIQIDKTKYFVDSFGFKKLG